MGFRRHFLFQFEPEQGRATSWYRNRKLYASRWTYLRVNNRKPVVTSVLSSNVFNHYKMETEKALIQDAAFCFSIKLVIKTEKFLEYVKHTISMLHEKSLQFSLE